MKATKYFAKSRGHPLLTLERLVHKVWVVLRKRFYAYDDLSAGGECRPLFIFLAAENRGFLVSTLGNSLFYQEVGFN